MSKVFDDKLANLNFAIFGYGNCKKSVYVVWGGGDFKIMRNKLVQLLFSNKKINVARFQAPLKIILCARQNIIAQY
jgi:hypothetical protein